MTERSSVPSSDDYWRDYLERRSLELKGKELPFEVVVVEVGTPIP